MNLRTGICAFFLLALGANTALAGDEDSHLAATHLLARRAHLSESDAALIARANWSLDMNLSTTALPYADSPSEVLRDPGNAERIKWWVRGDVYHSFGSSPEDVRAHLSVLRGAIPRVPRDRPETSEEHRSRMIAVGQYLHAMQDVYFHQADGKPLGSVLGHALSGASDDREGMDWHEADKVANHFDAALKAYNETAKVMEAVEQGKPIPDIDWHEAYVPDDRRVHGAVVNDNHIPDDIVKLAVAIGGAYGDWHGEHDVVDHELLQARLSTFWTLQYKTAGFEPFVTLGKGDRALIEYDKNPQLLLADEDVIADLMRRYPGGISFTEAAAQRLPIRMDIDGVLVDHGRIVLSGRSAGELLAFDAAQLLTAFRLACGRGDPYFSLDPVDGAQWMSAGKSLLEQDQREHDGREVQAAYIAADGSLLGPISFSRRQRASLPKGLESRLVWDPLESTCRHASLSIL